MDCKEIKIRQVSKEELDRICNDDLKKIRSCPQCGCLPQIIIDMHVYESNKVKIKCANCGYEKNVHLNSETLVSKKSLGTPITIQSLSESISNAIKSWNTFRTIQAEERMMQL